MGHVMRLLSFEIMLHDLTPLCVSVWCTTCDHVLSGYKEWRMNCRVNAKE